MSVESFDFIAATVPSLIRYAVQLLAKGEDKEVELMVPKHLSKIQKVADDCRDLAVAVDEKFQSVMNLICELLEACTLAEAEKGENLRKTKIAIKVVIWAAFCEKVPNVLSRSFGMTPTFLNF